MPLSFQGFGFTALLIMLAVLSASQLVRYVRERQRSKHRTVDKVDG
jgi:hypothetical protein